MFGAAYFGKSYFGAEYFGPANGTPPTPPPAEDVPLSGGKGDNERAAQRIAFKPTGLLHLPRKDGRKRVDDRVAESAGLHAEISAKLSREFAEEPAALEVPPVARMSLAQIEAEIGVLLSQKLRTEEDEMLLVMLIAACA